MARRKIREAKSKVNGAAQVLKQLNRSAHEEEHRTPNSSSPTIATFAAAYKWGF